MCGVYVIPGTVVSEDQTTPGTVVSVYNITTMCGVYVIQKPNDTWNSGISIQHNNDMTPGGSQTTPGTVVSVYNIITMCGVYVIQKPNDTWNSGISIQHNNDVWGIRDTEAKLTPGTSGVGSQTTPGTVVSVYNIITMCGVYVIQKPNNTWNSGISIQHNNDVWGIRDTEAKQHLEQWYQYTT
ncbi:unnamed protein product [Mytilus edulis]|uniref:Uncharacterized protein n=1 Tax=Mytilus edulis TaxID=6550 RepID=A0A8S3VIT1_MYTED|nr:unnamed protein product [Mytilus edulis]